MQLLLIEDSALLRTMSGMAFRHQLGTVRQAESGQEALDLLAASDRPFDAVLLDLQMPDMNGVELICALRRLPVHGRTPIVLTTAEADESRLMQEAVALGVAAVVKKPWMPQQLRAIVQQVVDPPTG